MLHTKSCTLNVAHWIMHTKSCTLNCAHNINIFFFLQIGWVTWWRVCYQWDRGCAMLGHIWKSCFTGLFELFPLNVAHWIMHTKSCTLNCAHNINIFFFFANWLSYLVEGLLSMGPGLCDAGTYLKILFHGFIWIIPTKFK